MISTAVRTASLETKPSSISPSSGMRKAPPTETMPAPVMTALSEVGPEGLAEVDLGVGELPEKEVGDAHLAAGAHDQFQRREARGPEAVLDGLGVDLLGAQLVLGHFADHGDDLLAAAVTESESENHFQVAGAVAAELVEGLADPGGQAVQVAEGVQPDAVVHDLGALLEEIFAEEVHQAFDLVGRALPVLRGERVESQRRQAEPARGAG